MVVPNVAPMKSRSSEICCALRLPAPFAQQIVGEIGEALFTGRVLHAAGA